MNYNNNTNCYKQIVLQLICFLIETSHNKLSSKEICKNYYTECITNMTIHVIMSCCIANF